MIEAGRISKLNLPGLSLDRANVLAGGVAILHGCFKSLKIDRMRVSTGALREGLLYDTIGRNTHEDVRVRTIEAIAERYQLDRDHAARVESTALRCLDQVAMAWSLHHPDDRWLLVWAATLHEVGLALSHSGHHNHGAYIVANTDMPGFTRDRQKLLAELIRAQRRRLRHTTLDELKALGGDTAVRLSLLLRLATTLNRNRDPAPAAPVRAQRGGQHPRAALPRGLARRPPVDPCRPPQSTRVPDRGRLRLQLRLAGGPRSRSTSRPAPRARTRLSRRP